jgi:hypothetical protein
LLQGRAMKAETKNVTGKKHSPDRGFGEKLHSTEARQMEKIHYFQQLTLAVYLPCDKRALKENPRV